MKMAVLHTVTIGLGILLSLNCVYGQGDKMKLLPPIKVTASTDLTQIAKDMLREMLDVDRAYLFYKADSVHLIKLMNTEQLTPSLFDKSGRITYQISCGNLTTLPDIIVQLLDLIYDDYVVNLAILVNRNGKRSWIINIQEGNKCYLIHQDEGPKEKPIPQIEEQPLNLSIRM